MMDLFGEIKKPERKKPTKKAHMTDGGQGDVEFKCAKCGWDSGWIEGAEDWSNTKILAGIDCGICNKITE